MIQEKRVVLFMGAPGSGKGTLSARCEHDLGWCQLSTGNLLRQHIIAHTEIGKQIDFILKSGKLVSDELVNSMVEEWLFEVKDSGCKGIILDGYPRTIAQAGALCTFLARNLPNFSLKVVRLRVHEQTAIDRMLKRLVCNNKDCQAIYSTAKSLPMSSSQMMKCGKCGSTIGRRKDDYESSIQERLVTHAKHENALLDFYKHHGVSIIECNAEQPVDSLFDEFKTLMNVH